MSNQQDRFQKVSPEEIVKKFFTGTKEDVIEILVGTRKKSLLERFVEEELTKGLSFTKLRRYYEQFLNIYEEAIEHKESRQSALSDEILVKLYLLKSHAVYDWAREGKKPGLRSFKDFINALILRIETLKDLERAKRLFEALVGYARASLKKN
jgi:CRISPR type III-A-associated protein Csm2